MKFNLSTILIGASIVAPTMAAVAKSYTPPPTYNCPMIAVDYTDKCGQPYGGQYKSCEKEPEWKKPVCICGYAQEKVLKNDCGETYGGQWKMCGKKCYQTYDGKWAECKGDTPFWPKPKCSKKCETKSKYYGPDLCGQKWGGSWEVCTTPYGGTTGSEPKWPIPKCDCVVKEKSYGTTKCPAKGSYKICSGPTGKKCYQQDGYTWGPCKGGDYPQWPAPKCGYY